MEQSYNRQYLIFLKIFDHKSQEDYLERIMSELLTNLSERVYEDHELLVENLLLWTRDSKNKLLFVERPDKTHLFLTPERFLLGPSDRGGGEYDDHSRNILLEEFFSSSNVGVPEVRDDVFYDLLASWQPERLVYIS